jgi:hypothetical protein
MTYEVGHAIPEVVSCQFPMSAVLAQSQFRSRGIFDGQSKAGFI